MKGIDEFRGIEEVILDHVLGVLSLFKDGSQIVVGGHFKDIPAVDIEIVLSDLLTYESPSYYHRYIPEEI